jgi:YVTN family beta-propeller protein
MARWRVRFAGSVALVAATLAVPTLSTTTPASADMVVNGCTIVSNPTSTHFTDCPNANFAGANLSSVNLSYANLSGATFAVCPSLCMAGDSADLSSANLSYANLAMAQFVNCIHPGYCISASAPNANFTGADLTSATLAECVFLQFFVCSAADFSGASMPGANLSFADVFDGNLDNTDLAGANLNGTILGGAGLGDANLSNTNLTDAVLSYEVYPQTQPSYAGLTGANVTGTALVPSNQSVTATSQVGAVATWPTPPAVTGATPGSCTPASGSTFPLFTSTVTCQVLDGYGDVATGTFQVNVTPTTQYFTRLLVPSDGTVVAGFQYLDAEAADTPGITSVTFELSGGGLANPVVIANATPTLFGWLAKWNTTIVSNDTYTLQSFATDAADNTDTSTGITITVNNQPPMTAVLIPSGGATVSGASQLLDASASSAIGIASVTFEVSGGFSNISDQVVATATPTLFGWLAKWNTTGVANGTYTLQSVATDPVKETTTSAPITITVDNTPPSTSLGIPSNGATLFGPAILDAAASDNVGVTKVEFHLTGGGLSDVSVATAVPTIYGWIADWNTKTVPNGTYTLQSVAYDAAGLSTHSAGIMVNVLNGPVAYVTGNGTVTPINTENNTPGQPITGVGPDNLAIAISPDGTTAYVSSFFGTITPINLVTGLAETPITMGTNFFVGPIAITPDGSTAYVGNENTGAVVPVDLATKAIGTPIPACTSTPDDRSGGIVISPDGATAYVSCTLSNSVVPINTSTNATESPIFVAPGPSALAITPNGATLYVANSGVFDVVNGQVMQISDGTTVTPVDLATGTAGHPITVGTEPEAVAITPDGTTAYVTNAASNTVSPIDIATNTAGSPIAVNGISPAPDAIAITPDGATAYVIANGIVPIDTATNTTGTAIPVGEGLTAIAIR